MQQIYLIRYMHMLTMQDMAYVLATGYVSMCILLSGVFIRKTEYKVAPMNWLSYISYTRCEIPSCTVRNLRCCVTFQASSCDAHR